MHCSSNGLGAVGEIDWSGIFRGAGETAAAIWGPPPLPETLPIATAPPWGSSLPTVQQAIDRIWGVSPLETGGYQVPAYAPAPAFGGLASPALLLGGAAIVAVLLMRRKR